MAVQQTVVQCLASAGVFAGFLGFLSGCESQVGGVPGLAAATSGASVTTGSGGGPIVGGGTSTSTGTATSTGGASSTGMTVAGDTGGTTATPELDCTEPHAVVVRARLLSSSQYTHTVRDLFAASGDPGASLGDQVFAQLDQAAVEMRATVAAAVAAEAAANLEAWAPCVPPESGDAAGCQQQMINEVGTRAFRRALTGDERAQMQALFDAGVNELDFATGVEWFLTGLLQSPDFLYQIAKPVAGEVPGTVRPLAASELASRLAHFVWDSPPDEQLMAAAAANQLVDPAQLAAEVERMIQDPKFMRGVQSFYSTWFNLDAFTTLARDAEGFDSTVVDSLSTSLLMSATELYASADPNISQLFSGETYYMNDALRSFYGLPSGGTEFTPASLAGESRRGVVTHPGLMALLARPSESFPVGRGLFVVRNLLCTPIPLPNGLAIPELPPAQEGMTTRERFEMHSSIPACSSCHVLFDSAGFALESFDEVGRFRTTDHGKPVDTSGTMALQKDIDGPFTTGDELLARMADSRDIRLCFAEQYLKHALARQQLVPEDGCSAQALGESFAETGDLRGLVAALVTTDAFRMRLAEGVD